MAGTRGRSQRYRAALLAALFLSALGVVAPPAAGAAPWTGRTFPKKYDLRALGRVTRVGKQANHSTCWIFSALGSLESCLLPGARLDLSENHMANLQGSRLRFEGRAPSTISTAYVARWAGPVLERDDRYPRPGASREGLRAVRHVQEVLFLPPRKSPRANAAIKWAVMEHGAVDAVMAYVRNDLNRATGAYYSRDTELDHHVCIVGWDDAYPAERFQGMYGPPPAPGAFLVRNSWGADWGSDGYLWVSYYDAAFARDMGLGTWGGCTSYAAVADIGDYSRNYGHDKLGVTGRVGYPDGGPVWAANRFTAASRRPIRAVGFYTLSSDTPYEVWAGPSLKQLTRRAKGVSALPGYTTVRLRTPLKVVKGRKFVVAIRLASPDGSYPLAVERGRRIPLGNSRVVFAATGASRGQSYVGAKRWRLKDLTLSLPRTNVCLKAFAD